MQRAIPREPSGSHSERLLRYRPSWAAHTAQPTSRQRSSTERLIAGHTRDFLLGNVAGPVARDFLLDYKIVFDLPKDLDQRVARFRRQIAEGFATNRLVDGKNSFDDRAGL